MAKLVHSHRLKRDDKRTATHIDSKGVHFGADEHDKSIAAIEWPEDIVLSDPVEHVHLNIRPTKLENGIVNWTYEPPDPSEADKVIGKVSVASK